MALELIDAEPKLVDLKFIGVDLEEAITEGMKRIIPNVNILYCVRHLKQRDEEKLKNLLAGLKLSAAGKKSAKAKIIQDIYGEREGTCYDYGLAEANNEEDFLTKLRFLEKRWESVCPGFFKWFCDHRTNKFLDSVICSARVGTEISGLYYQNDVEAQHFVEKKHQNFRKEDVLEVIKSFQSLINDQETDEVRALYGAGRYELAQSYKRFMVDSAKWHGWSEQRRLQHISAFRSFQPGLADSFKRPKKSGRKPSYQPKTKSVDPEIIRDRITNMFEETEENSDLPSSKNVIQNDDIPEIEEPQTVTVEEQNQTQLEDISEVRFADPREPPKKTFELHMRKNLPRSVKRCQGRCGKKITPDQPVWIIKSYGVTKWTDKKSGKEMSRYGPMYLHFNVECLEAFDSETFYGAGTRFDYSQIKIDKDNQKDLNSQEKKMLKSLNVVFL